MPAFESLVEQLDARWALISYSTDGNIPLRDLLTTLAGRGELSVIMQSYKRYRVSTPRMSRKSHNVEFVAMVDLHGRPSRRRVDGIIRRIERQEQDAVAA